MNKEYYNFDDVKKLTQEILRQMSLDDWRPDYIVGITRGGAVPAVLLSQYLKVPMNALKVSLRDHAATESNCWMAEDAFGYEYSDAPASGNSKKNILIVDDINDSGATFNWIVADWQANCLPDDPQWSDVWNNNVRFAVLVDNLSSNFQGVVRYAGAEINKAEADVWINFPWEDWWRT